MQNSAKTKRVPGYDAGSNTRRKLIAIIALVITIVVMLVILSMLQATILDSTRAFVRGEGLWAKAQKDAVFYLDSFADTGDERFFDAFERSIAIPLGDEQARRALQRKPPDIDAARRGFLDGHNHVDDVDSMIRFFRTFQHFPFVNDAIAIWTVGDGMIAQLTEQGQALKRAVENGDTETVRATISRIHALNMEIAEVENAFSDVLSEGARWSRTMMGRAIIATTALMLIVTLLVARRITHDIERSETALQRSENRFKSLYQSRLVGLFDWHRDGRILDANDTFLEMLGLQRDDLEHGRVNWRELTPEQDREVDERRLGQILASGSFPLFEKEFIHRDGSRVPVYLGAVLLEGDGDTGICFVLDLRQRKADETRLRLAASVFENSSEGIMVTDSEQRIIRVNRAFCAISGYSKDELLGGTPKLLSSGLMTEAFYTSLRTTLAEQGRWQGDIIDRRKDGSLFTVRLSINSVHDDQGRLNHYVAIFNDISERKLAEEQLRRLAHTDYLTGLANRAVYTERLEQAMRRARRRSTKVGLLFFDLDNFKSVNDLYGHEIGDRLLCEIAQRLRQLVREEDTVARLGGDEFVIIMEDLSSNADAAALADKLIAAIRGIIDIDGHAVQIGSSVGISIFPDDGKTGIELTRCADIAMYAAKASGRNCHYYFNPLLDNER